MQTHLVMTFIGADRPGLVELLAGRVADHGGNWLESRMCRLGGQFVGIARVEAPADRVPALRQALAGLHTEGLRVSVEGGGAVASAAQGLTATLELVGHDRPGILRSVTAVLARHGVNVEELTSECISAPMGGGNLFQARVCVQVPPACRVETVRADLEKIAGDMMVDITLRPASADK